MKYFTILMLFLPILVHSQNTNVQRFNESKNELKLNVGLALFEFPEISYHRILNGKSSLGISVGMNFNDEIDFNYYILPNYRYFFGSENATAVFAEGSLAIYSGHEWFIDLDGCNCTGNDEIGLGLSLALGTKIKIIDDIVGEIYAGAGTQVFELTSGETSLLYPRVGISLGKRF